MISRSSFRLGCTAGTVSISHQEADTQKMLAGPIGHRTPSKAAACRQSEFSESASPTSAQAESPAFWLLVTVIFALGFFWEFKRLSTLSHTKVEVPGQVMATLGSGAVWLCQEEGDYDNKGVITKVL
jgi:hypothetical protein